MPPFPVRTGETQKRENGGATRPASEGSPYKGKRERRRSRKATATEQAVHKVYGRAMACQLLETFLATLGVKFRRWIV